VLWYVFSQGETFHQYCMGAYNRMASHVHMSTAVKPSTEMRRKLRCEDYLSISEDEYPTIATYPELLCLAHTSHVMLVSDCADLVGLWRVFRNQIEIGIIACHGGFSMGKLASSSNSCRKTG
jgi:hypothetical protein